MLASGGTNSVRFKMRGVGLALPVSQSARESEPSHGYALMIIAFGAIIAILHYGRVFFVTALIATIIAFILDPFVGILVKLRFPRAVASLVVCALAALILYLAVLAAYSQITGLLDTMPSMSQRIGEMEESASKQILSLEDRIYKVIVPRRQILQEKKVEEIG